MQANLIPGQNLSLFAWEWGVPSETTPQPWLSALLLSYIIHGPIKYGA